MSACGHILCDAAQEEFIREARARLQPSPVRLHHVPRWARPGWRRAVRAYSLPAGASFRLLDHWGSTVRVADDGERYTDLVSEPYAASCAAVDPAQLGAFDRVFGVVGEVSDNSWWYPGHTIRITWREPARAPRVGVDSIATRTCVWCGTTIPDRGDDVIFERRWMVCRGACADECRARARDSTASPRGRLRSAAEHRAAVAADRPSQRASIGGWR